MSEHLRDQRERDRAPNPGRSFIVQAPAGSGKTELLVLRFLKMLALCREPEEVLAITFTRKAASEMRRRIVNTLVQESDGGAADVASDPPLEAQRREAADAVLIQNAKMGWDLLRNPGRLRIQTIDGFCRYLANRLPVLSRVGGGLNISKDVSDCFADAVANTLGRLGSGSAPDRDVERLLRHLDNDFDRAKKLLVDLLQRREQWLPYVMKTSESGDEAKRCSKEFVSDLVGDVLDKARRLVGPWEAKLVPLCNFAAWNLRRNPNQTGLQNDPEAWPEELVALPEARPGDLPRWKFLANLLLKKVQQKDLLQGPPKDSLRRQVNVKNGFPPGAKEGDAMLRTLMTQRKKEMDGLLKSLAEGLPADKDKYAMIKSLQDVQCSPSPASPSVGQWRLLVSLLRILKHLSAQLLVAFRKRRVVDHTQIAISARDALGQPQEPTEAALLLDYSIRHILIDEFQDTSQLQLDILELLIQGWQANDGRTLFLVGDPMQSCYSFRNANVGIYLGVRERGSLSEVELKPLTLSSNFRSRQGIVEWANDVFKGSFPAEPDSFRGAVPYSKSHVASLIDGERAACGEPAVAVTLIPYDQDGGSGLEKTDTEKKMDAERKEADLVVERIQHLRNSEPHDSIAVLVRSRKHLNTITPKLRDAGIDWRSNDIDKLAELPVIDDLLSLSRAVLNPGDHVAWLALLRAPWCGLDVADLHAVAETARGGSVPAALLREEGIEALSAGGRQRLAGLKPVVEFLTATRFRGTLRRTVEACWTLLHGADCCDNEVERDSADMFFGLLERHERGGGIDNFYRFEETVREAYAPSRGADSDVQLLTMHKAKGLEFDHVLLPGLAQETKSSRKPLLLWGERQNAHSEQRLLMAAPGAAGKERDPLYEWLYRERAERKQLENTRLLYIAVTRARRSVRLYATLESTKSDAKSDAKSDIEPDAKAPSRYSLLSRIWEEIKDRDEVERLRVERLPEGAEDREGRPPAGPTLIRRFVLPLALTAAQACAVDAQSPVPGAPPASASGRPGPPDRYATVQDIEGALIHRCLEAYVRCPDQTRFFDRIEGMRAMWRLEIGRERLDGEEVERSVDFIEKSVRKTVGAPELAWIFDPELEDSQCELKMLRTGNASIERSVIDRTFIDGHGARWIIDYKTARPPPSGGVEDFVQAQRQLHRGQLARYRSLFDGEVRVAILLTALPRLVELDAAELDAGAAD